MTGAFSIDPDDKKDIVDKVNEEFKEHNKENEVVYKDEFKPKPTGEIKKSSMDKLKKLGEDLGVNQLREDIDVMKLNISQLAESQQQIITAVNEVSNALNNNAQPQQPQQVTQGQQQISPENIQALVSIVDGLADTWKKIKGDNPPQQISPIISQEEINKKMAEAFYDNLETGESITRFIKDSLKKSATKKIIGESMKTIGNHNEPFHTPE